MLTVLRHRVVRFAAGILIVLGLVLWTVGPVFAHSNLVSSTPANGASLEQAPAEVTLTFSAAVIGNFTEVVVRSSDGTTLKTPAPVSADNVVTQALPDALPKGGYVVAYRVVSADSHPISGEVRFTVTVGAAASPKATASPEATTAPEATANPQASASATDGAPAPTGSATDTGPVSPSASTDAASADSGGSAGSVNWPLWAGVGVVVLLLAGGLVAVARRRGGHS